MPWVVQLNGKLADGTAVERRFAMGAGVAVTDDTYIDGGLLRWQGATQKVSIDGDGVVSSSLEVGEIQIANLPSDIGQPGPFDALAGYIWFHSLAQLYWLPGRVWADAVLVAQGQMGQPVANLSTSTQVASVLRFQLRDPRAHLDRDLQPLTYLGNNADNLPCGVEGDADLKGKPKPILYGTASNIPGVVVNRGLNIYQLADKPASVLCARDGAIPLTRGVARSSLSSLQTAVPAQGAYDTYSGAEGLFVKLGSNPRYRIGFDAQEGATEAERTHAQVWSRLSFDRAGRYILGVPNIDAAAVAAADAVDPHEVGFWWADKTSCAAAIDQILASFSGFERKDLVSKKWAIFKLREPQGAPTRNLVLLTPTSEMKAADRALMKLDRVQPTYLPKGIPAWKVNVQWGRNYSVMGPADFAGLAAARLKAKFATEWRTESDSDSSLLTLYVDSGHEMTIPTGYQPGDDGVTCPHAAAEAVRIRALYTADRPSYQTTHRPQRDDVVQIGDVLQLTYPMYGLALGKRFVVLQAADLVEAGVRTTTVVLGLQATDSPTADSTAVTADSTLLTADAA